MFTGMSLFQSAMGRVIVEKHLTDAFEAFLAGAGGIISALMRHEAATWREAILAGAGASFLGFAVAKMCHAGNIDEDLTTVFVSLSGWIGANRTSAILEGIIADKFGIGKNRGKEDEKSDDKDD